MSIYVNKIKIGYNNNRGNNIELNKEKLFAAMIKLNGAALKMYLYLASLPGGEHELFPKILCETVGISRSSEKNAFAELIRLGYLKEEERGLYFFKR